MVGGRQVDGCVGTYGHVRIPFSTGAALLTHVPTGDGLSGPKGGLVVSENVSRYTVTHDTEIDCHQHKKIVSLGFGCDSLILPPLL